MDKFNFQCTILGENTITGSLSTTSTVEQVKKWIFTNSPSLFSLSPEDFRIIVEPTHTIKDSLDDTNEIIFLDSHASLRRSFEKEQVITIHLISVKNFTEISPTFSRRRFTTQRKRSETFNNSKKEGYLTKRGNSFQSWKKRWCILQNNFIFYFRKKQDTEPLGAVPIQDCILCCLTPYAKRNYCFAVHTRSRIYYMTGSSLRESNEWITAINQCMQVLGIIPIDPNQVENSNTISVDSLPSRKSGHLYKTGKDIKTAWNKRYFRMKGSFIYYFKSVNSPSPCGYIPLQNAEIYIPLESISTKKYVFQIITLHRTYNLAAENEESMRTWMMEIEKAISELQGENALNYTDIISMQIPVSFWDNLKVVTYNVIENFCEYTTDIFKYNEWIVQKNEKIFGPIPKDDIEKDLFFSLMYKRLQDQKRISIRKKFIPAEISNAPIPDSYPDRIPVFFRLSTFDNVLKSVICNVNESLETGIRKVITKKNLRSNTCPDINFPMNSKRQATNFGKGRILKFGEESATNYYIARISGIYQYIEDSSVQLSSIRYVQECIKRGKKIKFTLDERNMIEQSQKTVTKSKHKISSLHTKKEQCFAINAINIPFVVKVIMVENSEMFDNIIQIMKSASEEVLFYVECSIMFGNELIGTLMRTDKQLNFLFAQILTTNISYSQLPKESRLLCSLHVRTSDGDTMLASSQYQLFDIFGKILVGKQKLLLESRKSIKTNTNNVKAELLVEFISSPYPIVHLPMPIKLKEMLPPTPQDLEALEEILWYHPLQWLKEHEKKLVWRNRIFIENNYPNFLPVVINSVPWLIPDQVQELHMLLRKWPPLTPTAALRLLDSNYPDSEVRKFAIRCINQFTDTELPLYLLQLVQAIKYEPFYFSELVMFLLCRSLRDADIFGHELFWFLKSELDINPLNIRFRCILEQFMLIHSSKSQNIYRQVSLISSLKNVAYLVKATKENKRDQVLQDALSQLQFPPGIVLPINPAVHVRSLIVKKCKWLDSFTVPLWLVFENYDEHEDPIYVIFKAGDDLRQDALTVQMLSIMDNLWRNAGMDMHLTPYRVVATGKESGMIEVVLNSETTAKIQKMAGGATAVFSIKPLTNWLLQNNKVSSEYDKAVNNFMISMAGYCVATYVLGIGDRHNDNIMVTKEGHLFHIDFAHFLGNVMKFYGIKRERAPFVLTPDFVNVIGGKDSPGWDKFVNLCCESFNFMRKHAHIFINLFSLMISSGIPQLKAQEDLHYLIESFCVGKKDKEAREIYTSLIIESLNTKATQLNFAIHILAHRD